MRYFKIGSEEEAEKISASLYSCMKPKDAQTVYLFSWVTFEKQTYLAVPEIMQPVIEKTDAKLADAVAVMQIEKTVYSDKLTNPVEIVKLLEGLEEVSEKVIIEFYSKQTIPV